jgi:pyrroloquinoline quinone (PQQ) biosynthesis protein C
MYPKLRENVWHIDPQQETAVLITSRQTFAVPTERALQFLQMRSYCTGWHSIDSIADRSGFSSDDVNAILDSLAPAGIVYSDSDRGDTVSHDEVCDVLVRACRIWSAELQLSYIGNEFSAGHLPKPVLIGWLLEMYHYIRDFPVAIEHGARHASGRLKALLTKYAAQETGHEGFVLQSLVNLGMSAREVETSIPLLSTRLIGFLMRELFELAPSATLLVAAVIEAQGFAEAQIDSFKVSLDAHYGIGLHALDPYFEHQKIDVDMGHATLLSENLDLVQIDDRSTLDQVVNKIHDLKHAFDLQGLEIKAYYTTLNGKYFPRQPVDFEAI